MAGTIDILSLEKELASKSTNSIKSALKSVISSTTHSRTGNALRVASAGSKFKNDRLQRITVKAPHYIFKQNYGFEGTKSNGINMRLKQTSVIEKALNESNVLETLADGISELRLSQVTALIQFTKNGR